MNLILRLARKELQHGQNGFFAYLLLALFAVSLALPAFWVHGASNIFITGLADIAPLLANFPLYLAVLVPALAMRCWSHEHAMGTGELLATWPIADHQVLFGKFLGLFALVAAALAATAPIPILVAQLGDLDLGPVLGAYAGALLLGAACLAICLFLGLLLRDPVSVFLLGLAALATAMALPPALNLHLRFARIARGQLDLGDLAFYAVVTLTFLALAMLLWRLRRGGVQSLAVLGRALLTLLLGALGILGASQIQRRFDLTGDRLYALNQATLDLLARLPGPVEMEVFFSRELPPRFQPVADYVKAQLQQYSDHSGGKLSLSFRDPDNDEEARSRALALGIVETRASVYSGNELQAQNLWFGLGLSYRDQHEVFPSVQSIENLEYDISAALLRLTRTQKAQVTFVGPTYLEGEAVVFDLDYDMAPIKKALEPLFEVEQVRLTESTALDLSHTDVLIAWSLSHFNETQLYALDQYLLQGRPALLLTSGALVTPNIGLAQVVPQNRADDFFAHLGFEVNRDLVCDNSCTKIKYSNVYPPVFQPYPLFPSLSHAAAGLSAEHETTAGLKKLILPWASSLTVKPDGPLAATVIGRSSEQSWHQTPPFAIDPAKLPGPTSFERYNLGLALTGRPATFFAEPPAGADPSKHLAHASKPISLLVWGSEHVLTQTRDSAVFPWITQSAAFLAQRNDLAGIDRRENAFRPIRPLTRADQQPYRWLSVTIVPVLLLLAALAREFRRRRRRFPALVAGPS